MEMWIYHSQAMKRLYRRPLYKSIYGCVFFGIGTVLFLHKSLKNRGKSFLKLDNMKKLRIPDETWANSYIIGQCRSDLIVPERLI